MRTWPVNHPGVVSFPDGLQVMGGSWRRYVGSEKNSPEFICLLLGHAPGGVSCSYEWVQWRDFSVPASTDRAIAALHNVRERALYERVAVMCGGGIGRTGTAIAVLAAMSGVPAAGAVDWARQNYHRRAVEMPWQRHWVRTVSRELSSG